VKSDVLPTNLILTGHNWFCFHVSSAFGMQGSYIRIFKFISTIS